MGNLLSSISLFIARRTDATPQAGAARDMPASNGTRPSNAPQSQSLLLLQPSDEPSAASAAGASLPLVPYPTQRDGPSPAKGRSSRALLRVSSGVAMTTRTTPTTQTIATRLHESHPARPALTETEKVRLQVMQVQIRLGSLSLYEGPIDGILNPETVTAIRHFQTLKGMRSTGALAAGTLSALGVPPIA